MERIHGSLETGNRRNHAFAAKQNELQFNMDNADRNYSRHSNLPAQCQRIMVVINYPNGCIFQYVYRSTRQLAEDEIAAEDV